jgi:hypothetical protein
MKRRPRNGSRPGAGPALERIRAEELRAWRYDPVIVDALLEIGCRFAVPRTTSGLVEQQRVFRRWL